jgi:hypothetical protein
MNSLTPDLWVCNSDGPWIPRNLYSDALLRFVFDHFSLFQVKIVAVNILILILIEIQILARENTETFYPATHRRHRTDFNKTLQYSVHLYRFSNCSVWFINVLLVCFHFAFADLEDVTKITDQVVKAVAEINFDVTCVQLETNLAVDCLRLFCIFLYF